MNINMKPGNAGPTPPHLQHCTEETIPGKSFTQRPEYPPDRDNPGSVNITPPCRPLTYLACPYSSPDKSLVEWRYQQATKAAGWLLTKRGLNVFSPITHSHPLHKAAGGCPGDWKFWEKIDREYLSCSQRLVVLMLAGWRKSVGVQAEIKIAEEQGIPVEYLVVGLGDGQPYIISDNRDWGSYKPSDDPGFDHEPADTGLHAKIRAALCPELGTPQFDPNCGFDTVVIPDGMTNPKDLIGLTKPPLRLVPPALLLFVSRVMGLGAAKYGPYNWRSKNVRLSIYLEAAMRHILACQDGEETDPESGQPHIAHAAACMGIVLDAKATGNLIDDRPTPGPAARLIAEMTETKP